MTNKAIKYSKIQNKRTIRTELIFAPILILSPFIVALIFILEWYYNGFLLENSNYNILFILGLIILIGNFTFDIPFIKSLKI